MPDGEKQNGKRQSANQLTLVFGAISIIMVLTANAVIFAYQYGRLSARVDSIEIQVNQARIEIRDGRIEMLNELQRLR